MFESKINSFRGLLISQLAFKYERSIENKHNIETRIASYCATSTVNSDHSLITKQQKQFQNTVNFSARCDKRILNKNYSGGIFDNHSKIHNMENKFCEKGLEKN